VQYGFGQLSFTMMEHGLLDELRLWVFPLFVGKADPSELLYRHCPGAIFALTDTTTLENGVVILSYRYPQSD
jgi:riboflavin biosynthesis pyrimidine reductase